MAGSGGVFHGHFLGNQIYKEVPKKGEHAAMQGSARQDTFLVFSFVIRIQLPLRLSRGHIYYGLFMIYTHDFISANGWLDVSFVSGSDSGYCEGHDGIRNYGYTGLRDLLAEPISV